MNTVRSFYAQTCELRSQIEDRRLFGELLKMEIRAATITFAKRKAQMNHNKENAGSQRGLGLQGSGLKNAGLQGSKAKISVL